MGGESSYCTSHTIERMYIGVGGESSYCTPYTIERVYMGCGWGI